MDYSLQFKNAAVARGAATEIRVSWGEYMGNKMGDFGAETGCRIVYECTSSRSELENELPMFKALSEENNIALRIPAIDYELAEVLKGMNIPFFFGTRVSAWDEVQDMCKMGVSDIYITNELGFCLGDVHDVCGQKSIKIRVYPDVAQSLGKLNQGEVDNFFILPEDMHLYSTFVDVVEFYQTEKEAVLYKVYCQKGLWRDDARLIIYGLKDCLDGRHLTGYFGKNRLHCGKRCIKRKCCVRCQDEVRLTEVIKNK